MRCDPPGCPHVSRRLRRVSPRPPDLGPVRWFPRPASPREYPGLFLLRDPPLPSPLPPPPPGRHRGGALPLSVYPASVGLQRPPDCPRVLHEHRSASLHRRGTGRLLRGGFSGDLDRAATRPPGPPPSAVSRGVSARRLRN